MRNQQILIFDKEPKRLKCKIAKFMPKINLTYPEKMKIRRVYSSPFFDRYFDIFTIEISQVRFHNRIPRLGIMLNSYFKLIS